MSRELAIEKLQKELQEMGRVSREIQIMKDAVCSALKDFCEQDDEFAQAVLQGGSFTACMQAVAKDAGAGISDADAYRRAVQFYFPGADIRFHMTIDLCAGVEDQAGSDELKIEKRKVIDLFDLML